MKKICTLSDIRYLNRGLALIDSLNRYNDVYVYYLCMDEKCYHVLKNKHLKNVEVLFINDIIHKDCKFDIKLSYQNYNVVHDSSKSVSEVELEMYYKMSSYFPDYCLKKYDIDHIIYIDSDIYFYKSLDYIFEDVKDKSFGFVEHRLPWIPHCGKFNVGVIYMKNDNNTASILDLWKYCVNTPNNEFEKDYGVCGDQKYLELIEKNFQDSIAIIGKSTGHLAPWNLMYHQYTYDGRIIWNEKAQDLVYFHFSNFYPNFENDTYIIAPRHGIESVSNIEWLDKKCKEYFYKLKENKGVLE